MGAMKAAPMKAMKAAPMKAMKAAPMKAMKKVKKVSIIARGKLAKVAVFKGKKARTVGGLTKDTLTKSKSGKIVRGCIRTSQEGVCAERTEEVVRCFEAGTQRD